MNSDNAIEVKKLSKVFRTYKRGGGLKESVKALFSRKYEDIYAVKEIDFTIKSGELVAFIGPNGAGKTTTLKMLSGLLYPDEGEVNVMGYKPFERKAEYLKQISLVMGQKSQLWWDLPAIDTFELHKDIYEIPADQFKKNLDQLTEMLNIGDAVYTQVRKMSLGQRMKCELIASLLHSPKVLFLDEPTIGLDTITQKNVRDFIANYNNENGATIMLTSHYMEDIKELCKRVIVINNGVVSFDGKLDDLITKYADYKLIEIVFNKKVAKVDLEQISKVESMSDYKAVIKADRKSAATITSHILAKYDIDDINIMEPKIESIISQIYSSDKV